ncbi:hypothetical protein GCM10009527_031560 [Actinomadura nitritigenes]|uniref:methyltransferase domain-containing protein n=1 Tax=Actinomadura nitritigenes TaxID=134602 RepID=UPI001FB65BB5|nr:methyltransferase domain-containing protein [Actinomadura nitritigenes]
MDQKQTAGRTSGETDALIALLDIGDSIPGASELRARSYELLGIAPDAAVVDVGCGSGRAVAEMAERGARAVGVDLDERMVAVAGERWPAADFRVANAYELPFADGELHGYRAEKMYHVLDDPARAIGEARRVLAPGGRLVLIGQDWDTFVIDADDEALTRTIVHARRPGPHAPRRPPQPQPPPRRGLRRRRRRGPHQGLHRRDDGARPGRPRRGGALGRGDQRRAGRSLGRRAA